LDGDRARRAISEGDGGRLEEEEKEKRGKRGSHAKGEICDPMLVQVFSRDDYRRGGLKWFEML